MHSKVKTSLTRKQVESAPAYDFLLALNRGDEEGIYNHYGRRGYWHEKSGREAPESVAAAGHIDSVPQPFRCNIVHHPAADILICPPATLISRAAHDAAGRIAIGGQNQPHSPGPR